MKKINTIIQLLILIFIITSCSKLADLDTDLQVDTIKQEQAIDTDIDTEGQEEQGQEVTIEEAKEPEIIYKISEETKLKNNLEFKYQDQLIDNESAFTTTDTLIGINTEKGIRLFGNHSSFLKDQRTPALDLSHAIGISLKTYEATLYIINKERYYTSMNILEYAIDTQKYLGIFAEDNSFKGSLALEGRITDILNLGSSGIIVVESIKENNYKFSRINLVNEWNQEAYIEMDESYDFVGIGKTNNEYQAIYEKADKSQISMLFAQEDNEKDNSDSEVSVKSLEPLVFSGFIDGIYYIQGSFSETNVDYREIQLYGTPYIPYSSDEIDIDLIDYKIIDESKYLLEYKTNLLYKLEVNTTKLVYQEPILRYDLTDEYLIYTGADKNGLYLYNFKEGEEIQISKDTCDRLKIVDDQIFYRNISDGNLYVYDHTNLSTRKLIDEDNISSIEYVNKWVLVSVANRIIIIDNSTKEILKELDGYTYVVNPDNNEVIYQLNTMIRMYNLSTKEHKLLCFNELFYSFIEIVDNKFVLAIEDGPPGYSLIEYDEFKFYTNYEMFEHKLNDDYTIVETGSMYAMAFYIYENKTMEYNYVISSWEESSLIFSMNEGSNQSLDIYHDGEFIYYKIGSDGEKWIKYSPIDHSKEVLEDIDTDGLEKIIGELRGA